MYPISNTCGPSTLLSLDVNNKNDDDIHEDNHYNDHNNTDNNNNNKIGNDSDD